MREVDALARFAPTEHEFAVTTAARQSARGELTMRELIDGGRPVGGVGFRLFDVGVVSAIALHS
ncbi:hypothetical protein G5C65_09340 [Streptomyces sp. SB3404]|uniref:Uncharacterized protein n=1 Tax=Streptomyces boncukensis TaxID=2711219 RepID=A0A6G4WU74_9ACTN|nr:hypothetical protein [Streptomyces boncukensis]